MTELIYTNTTMKMLTKVLPKVEVSPNIFGLLNVRLGSDKMINGSFDSADGWSGVSATFSIVNDRGRCTKTGDNIGYIRHDTEVLTVGTWRIEALARKAIGDTTGLLRAYTSSFGLIGSSDNVILSDGDSMISFDITVASEDFIKIYCGVAGKVGGGGDASDFDNITVREIITG